MINYRKLSFYCIFIITIGLLLLRLLQNSIGPNAVGVTFTERAITNLFIPEGWGFFTRSPRDTKFTLYTALPGNKLGNLVTYRNSSAQNLFGLSRRSRRLNMEFSSFLSRIPEKSWVDSTNGSPNLYNEISMKYSPERFIMLKPGSYFIKKFELAPWAWASFPDHFSSTAYYVKVDLR